MVLNNILISFFLHADVKFSQDHLLKTIFLHCIGFCFSIKKKKIVLVKKLFCERKMQLVIW